jgi:hypothetical protein
LLSISPDLQIVPEVPPQGLTAMSAPDPAVREALRQAGIYRYPVVDYKGWNRILKVHGLAVFDPSKKPPKRKPRKAVSPS